MARVNVTLREASLEERGEVRRLLADYLFEFDGRTEEYPYLDDYWREPERKPFLIDDDGEVAGLCPIRTHEDG